MSLYFIGEMRREQRFWHLNDARNLRQTLHERLWEPRQGSRGPVYVMQRFIANISSGKVVSNSRENVYICIADGTERQRNDQSSTDNAAFQALPVTLIASRIKAVTRPFCTSTLAGGWANLHSVSGLVHLLRWNSLQTSSCSHRESLPFSRLFMLTIAILPLLEDRESPPSVGLYRERVVTPRTILSLSFSFSFSLSLSLSLCRSKLLLVMIGSFSPVACTRVD
ncbi:hypothetical protein ALC62_01543 [Cyphomyrmex costatus]|uniref:Uncharacterized protein n=1 Tax=Cyphomyrmex costatus TaxID=456900 RepID=A0A195D3A3_9HYME|nr:hypothetical protein ALC62_01543 [Cyphomyrmex costatus]